MWKQIEINGAHLYTLQFPDDQAVTSGDREDVN